MQEIEHLERCKILLILILAVSLKAELPTNIKYAAKVYSGISNILNDDYDQAKKNFIFFTEKNPDSPLGGILYCGALIFEREHADNYYNSKKIDSLLVLSQDSCEKMLQRSPDELWPNYLMALTKTYQTYWKLFQSNYLDGFTEGFIALQYFEKCLDIDSTFVEAKVAIGNYKYWSSVKTESLHWLPFIEDNREVGLNALELALNNSFLNKDFALISLSYAYVNEERFLTAIKIAENLLSKYPKSARIKALLAKALESLEPNRSIELYKELLARFQKANIENPHKVIELKNDLAKLYYKLEKYEKAEEICNQVLSMPEINEKYHVQIIPLIEQIVELKDSATYRLTAHPKN